MWMDDVLMADYRPLVVGSRVQVAGEQTYRWFVLCQCGAHEYGSLPRTPWRYLILRFEAWRDAVEFAHRHAAAHDRYSRFGIAESCE